MCNYEQDTAKSRQAMQEAFEAMQAALMRLIKQLNSPLTDGDVSGLRFTSTWDGKDVQAARAALALADKVSR